MQRAQEGRAALLAKIAELEQRAQDDMRVTQEDVARVEGENRRLMDEVRDA